VLGDLRTTGIEELCWRKTQSYQPELRWTLLPRQYTTDYGLTRQPLQRVNVGVLNRLKSGLDYWLLAMNRQDFHQTDWFWDWKIVLQSTIELGTILEERPHCDSPDDYVCELQNRLRQVHDLARTQLAHAAERRKTEYDSRVKSVSFCRGMWVWYYSPRRFLERNLKWTKYCGPYLIVRCIEPSHYVIQKP